MAVRNLDSGLTLEGADLGLEGDVRDEREGRELAQGTIRFSRHLREVREEDRSKQDLEELLALARATKELEIQRLSRQLELAYLQIKQENGKEKFYETLLVYYQTQFNELLAHIDYDSRTELPTGRKLISDLERLDKIPSANTLILLDIDKFKLVNDTLGHLTGDEVLFQAAKILKEVFGKIPGAIVARDGGEEFLVYLPVDPEEVLKLLKDDFFEADGGWGGRLGFVFKNEETGTSGIRITFSGGIVPIKPDEATGQLRKKGIKQAKHFADRVVYSCKDNDHERFPQGGDRNRIEIFNPPLHKELADRRRSTERRQQ